uniref:Integrase catalytic domain-containing protein n=1 Tax=Caenorhabditis japonica TaxID=281687 RepID=A0A8R1EEU6_CAEJA
MRRSPQQRHATHGVASLPLPDCKAETVARAILNECLLKFGCPGGIVSDPAKTFTAEAFKQFCGLLRVSHHLAIPYHSRGNGATERTFRTFHSLMSKYVNEAHTDWDTILPYITFCYNTTIHSTTGETPFFLLFGRDPVFTID